MRKWVPVEKQLPPAGKCVLVWYTSARNNSPEFGIAYRSVMGQWTVYHNTMYMCYAWTRLPKPPKEDVKR